ncbi:MAG: hypothetical protein GYA51_17885 [Candidatus Methanofastidiosa archaeon]|nr:hypothetical protein [Candidatus Methanofastidiosa archaeon]
MQNREYRYALSVTSQIFFCGIPFRLDTTPKCPINCMYCFAMARGGRRTKLDLFANPEKIIRKIKKSISSSGKDINSQLINSRMPIHFGGMSDPFSSNKSRKISLKLLDYLVQEKYPVVMSTKQTNIFGDKYFQDLIHKKSNLVIQVSISSLNSKFLKEIEPNAPLPNERISAISELNKIGVPVIARIQPLFPWQISEVTNELIPALAETGVNHVVVEFLKLPVESLSFPYNFFNNVIGFDIKKYFAENNAQLMSREWLFPTRRKWDLLQPVIQSIRKYGMTYGAADYGLNHLGDTECCCGIDKYANFDGYFKSFTSTIRNSRDSYVHFPVHMKEKYLEKSIKMYINSQCRIEGENNIYNILKSKWNRPKSINAPDSFLGITYSGEKDNWGNCVYIKEEI